MVVTGEGWRQTLLRIIVKKAMALFELIGAASHTVGWKCEAEGPTVPIGFHCIGSLEENLSVFQERGSTSISRTTVAIAPYYLCFTPTDQAYRDGLDVDVHIPMQGDCA